MCVCVCVCMCVCVCVCVCADVWTALGVQVSSQTERGDVGGGWGEINRQLNWKVAEKEGELGFWKRRRKELCELHH